jgi:PAS domain S-box-containing protein
MPDNYLINSPNEADRNYKESIEKSDISRSLLGQPEDKYRHLESKFSQEKALLAVSKKIQASLNLESLFETVVTEVRDCLKVDRVAIYRFAPGTENPGIQAETGLLASRVTAYPPGEFICENVGQNFPSALGMKIEKQSLAAKEIANYHQGEIWAFNHIDAAGLPSWDWEIMGLLLQVKANLTLPILTREKAWGLLCVHQCSEPRSWQESETKLAQNIALQLGIAVQQMESVQELRQQSEKLAFSVDQAVGREKAVAAIINRIRRSLDLPTVFQTTASEVRQLLQCDRVAIFRFEPNSNYTDGEIVAEDVVPPFASTIARKVHDHCFGGQYASQYQQGRMQVLADIYAAGLSDCHQAILADFQVRANLVMPLLQGEKLWGLLCIHQCSEPRAWQDREIEFVSQIADHLAVALQQAEYVAQLQDQSQQLVASVRQQKVLAAVIDKIRRSLNLDTVFQTTAAEVRHLLQADRVAIYRFNSDWSGEFVMDSVAQGWTSIVQQRLKRLGSGNVGECAVKSDPVTFDDYSQFTDSYIQETQGGEFKHGEICLVCPDIYHADFPQCYIETLERYQARAYAVVSIYQGEKLWGLLAAYQNSQPRYWQQSDVNFLLQIGTQLGVAIQEAELLTQTQQRSVELETALTTQLRKRADELAEEAQRERALAEVIEKIRQTLDLDTIFHTAACELRQQMHADRVGVFRFASNSCYEGEFISEDVLPPFHSALASEVRDRCFAEQFVHEYRRGRVLSIPDIYNDGLSDCHIKILERFQIRANLIVPVLKGEQLWGLLCIHQCSSPRHWQPREIEFVRKIAIQLGVAVQQAQLLEQAEQRSEALQEALAQVQAQKEQLTRATEQERALGQVIDKIRQTLDLETIFQTTAIEVRRLLNADRVGMFRFDSAMTPEEERGKRLMVQEKVPPYSRGEFVSEDLIPSFASALAAKIEDHCFGDHHALYYQQGRIWAANDIYAANISQCHKDILERFQVRANLVVPLLKGEELWGLLCIHQCSGPREWQDWEIEFVKKIAVNLGVALQQAELLNQAQQRSQELQIALAQVQAQKEHQAKLAQQERTLARVISRIRQTLELEAIFSSTTQEVRQMLNCDRLVVYQFNPDWSGQFVYESHSEGWKSLLIGSDIDPVWRDPYLQETQGGRYANHETFAIDDLDQVELAACHREILESFEVKALAVVPVFVGDKLWGLLGAYEHQSPRHWEDREIALLAQVANQLGVGINQAELLTQTKTQSRQLRSTLADLSAIIDNLADGLLVTDTSGRITRFNPALLAMFNLQGVDLRGRQLAENFPPELVKLVLQTERSEQKVVTVDVELENNRAGQALATSIVKEAEMDEGEQCLGSVILIRDVTVEREVDRMKTEFLATVSHELRTPLTSVLGFASIIKEKLEEVILPGIAPENHKTFKATQRVLDNINIIVSEAERLTSLINDVLDIAKMEAGYVEWNIKPDDPVQILKQALAATSSLFERHQLQLIQKIPSELPQVLVDRDRMIQVVINLISNAVKFSEKGCVICEAAVQPCSLDSFAAHFAHKFTDPFNLGVSLDSEQELTIRITDTGIGIAEDDQSKVFERFKQVGNILTNKPKGTGLGLPICKQIVEHHGGRIWVESKLGLGSTFSFTIPIVKQEN